MKKTIVTLTDDLDGSAGAETHNLAIDGYAIEIDLSAVNRKKLYEALRPYLAAGRRAAGKQAPGPIRSGIRIWWKRHPKGLPKFNARGAIPAAVQEAWRDAQGRT